ncbi:MAG: 16S rRNA (adenine(1518)-N(6)/adenine(1519)-N(6))-dimethyltransferase RsmA [Candidatus Liptonbacteria bacterium]|nr:16S rRNA (adenine(1518)-N(6)/adenine(1519)-N(6))-dimethyltransferase RsmA [Candidatus Liptonbacteria bacterium]
MPRQKLGQHFLKNSAILERIAEVITSLPGEAIVEIGPGHGELTGILARSEERGARRIIAVEKDAALAEALQEKYKNDPRVEIIPGDIRTLLSTPYPLLPLRSYLLVGNLPYYLTGYLLRLISNLPRLPDACVFLMQQEVGERLAAKPPGMNKLSASVQLDWEPELVLKIPRQEFSPPPQVDGVLVVLRRRQPPSVTRRDQYFQLVNLLFRQPRKTLLNNLTAAGLAGGRLEPKLWLQELGFDPQVRPGNLSLDDLERLTHVLEEVE